MVFGEYSNQEVISQYYYYSEVLPRFGFHFFCLWLKCKIWNELIWNVRNQNKLQELESSKIIYLQSHKIL